MIKRIIASFLCATVLTAIIPEYKTFASDNVIEIYVAPDGNDKASGAKEEPLASLKAAKEKVNEIKHKGIPVNVYFRGGEYRMTETVEFEKNDSGIKDAPVTYMAYGDEKPIFTGAIKIETEDFERVTGKMYERLPDISRDFVGVADLKKKGISELTNFTAESVIGGLSNQSEIAILEDVNTEFYFNHRPMTLAQWPNGSEDRAKVTKVVSNWEFGGDTNGRIKNWVNAENPIMTGLIRLGFGLTSAPIKGFDVENETMIFQRPATNDLRGGVKTKDTLGDTPLVNGNWSIQNLIEELDIPGEFYLDYEDLKLYFYPPYSTVDIDMSLAVGENPFITMDEASNITFKGLAFEKNRQNVVELRATDNIKFLACEFRHIAMRGIVLTEECHNTLIDGCDFNSMGHVSVIINDILYETIDVDKIDRVKLIPQNNIVNNCSFWDISTKFMGHSGAININGVGNSITNCKFHEARGSAIFWTGNDHKFNNNEFYSILKFVRDQGGIYNGRSLVQRGTEMSYNYFHNIDTTSTAEGSVRCIYNDDTLGGTDIHHNIFVGVEQPFALAGGADTKLHSNIVAKNELAGTFASQGWTSSQFKSAYSHFRNHQLPLVYSLDSFKKYENMRKVFWGKDWPSYGGVFRGNLFFQNQVKYPSLAEGVQILGESLDNNLIYDDTMYEEMFNDPDGGDFTIKEDYKLPKGYEPLKDIKLDKIGIYESENRKDCIQNISEFNLYYPYNFTDNLSGREIFLQWEESIGSDEYIVEIALDEGFSSVVGTYTVPINYAIIDDLDNDATEYFWRVTAVAKGKDNKETKLNSGGARRFRTQAFDIVDKSLLEETLKQAENTLPQLTEGVEGGNIAFGATENLKHHIKTAKEFMESKKCLQSEIDTIVNLLKKEMSNIGKTVVKNYTGIDSILDAKDSWVNNTRGNGLSYVDGGVKIDNTSKTDMAVYTNIAAPIERNKLFCFKLNIHIPDGAGGGKWQAVGFHKKEDAGQQLWTKTSYGYLFLIKNDIIEVQLWNGKDQRIIGTIPNTLPKGEDSNVKFGVLDFGPGQRIILEINGVTVFDHAEYVDLLRDDLYFSLYDSPKPDGAINCKEMFLKVASSEDIPDSDISLGNKLSVGDNDNAAAIKSMSGVQEVSIANGYKVSEEKMDNLKSISFNIKPQLSENEQGVVFRLSDKIFNENTSDYYMLSFKNGKLIMKKNSQGIKQTLAIIKTNAIKTNEWNDIKIYTVYENGGVRIIVYRGDEEVINFLDVQPIKRAGYFGIFNNTSSEMSVKP